jgi:hypothetical protein
MSKTRNVVRISAILYVVAIICFFWGLAAGKNKVFPWQHIAPFYDRLHAVLTFKDGREKSTRDRILLDRLERRVAYQTPGFVKHDNTFTDDGYLLISRYSKPLGKSTVELFSIADQKVLHAWPLPRQEIENNTHKMKIKIGNPLRKNSFRPLHPLLLDDGGLIFNAGLPSPLVRLDACGNLVWMIDRNFHHSNEFDHDGNIVSPIVLDGNGPTVWPIQDDGFATVSPEGQVLREYSVTDILLKNGYRELVYGVGNFMHDRIHLNDAQPVLFRTGDAEVGDILLSIRHLSSVASFHPESGRIKWLKTGPWLNQHDINQLEGGTYSIFGNEVVRSAGMRTIFVNGEASSVYLFNPRDGSVTQPFSKIMTEYKIGTLTAGRARMLDNGDVYIEATDEGKLFRISKDRVRWEYVNAATPDTIGLFSWSRYLKKDELDLKWMENLTCD